MFEKEAEEYGLQQALWCESECGDLRNAFKAGAEFGYNKANEWHYVKDELPDHNGQFYVALKGQTETFILNYEYDEYDESKMAWLDEDDTNFDDEVYAWREKLEAPELPRPNREVTNESRL